MHRLLLTAAASAVVLMISTPAAAQNFAAASGSSYGRYGLIGVPANSNSGGVRIHRGHGGGFPGYYSSGYNDYGDYDANRSFDPDKWNDWWHDRPDRAFPRWMSRNQDCARRWYSGDVLTC
jgi:hypothetical protein